MSVAIATRSMSRWFSPVGLSSRRDEYENAGRLGRALRNYTRPRTEHEKLIVSHYRLAFYVARQFTGRGVPFDDLVAEAMYGLCLAAKKYDPAQGEYSTYAVIVCRSQLHTLVRAHRTTRGKTVGDQKILPKYYRAVNSWVARYGRAPTVEEISLLLSMSEHRVRMLQVADHNSVVSLTPTKVRCDDVPATMTVNPEQVLTLKQHLEFIWTVRDELYRKVQASNWPAPDKRIFCLRWRLGEPGLTLRTIIDIGRIVGVTKSRVSRVLKRCWASLYRLGTHSCVTADWLTTLPNQVEAIAHAIGVATVVEFFGPEQLWDPED